MIDRKSLDGEEKKNLILNYYKDKTYVNLVYNQGDGNRYWNGFIQNVDLIDEGFVDFFDVVIKSSFPIQLDKISIIQLSFKRDISVEQAKKIWEKFQNARI